MGSLPATTIFIFVLRLSRGSTHLCFLLGYYWHSVHSISSQGYLLSLVMMNLLISTLSVMISQCIGYPLNFYYNVLIYIKNLFIMSVGQAQIKQIHQSYQTQHKVSSIYEKFQKAHENMSSFQQMLTKFSTSKKNANDPKVHTFSVSQPLQLSCDESENDNEKRVIGQQKNYKTKTQKRRSKEKSTKSQNDRNKYLQKQTEQHNRAIFPQKGSTTKLHLSEGWVYLGQIFQEKFHNYGHLLKNGQNIYVGGFKNGKMHGLGSLYRCTTFEELIDISANIKDSQISKNQASNAEQQNRQTIDWIKYEGQFKEGHVTGYGNLTLTDGQVIVGYWRRGKPQYFTKVQYNQLSKNLNQ